MPFKNPDFACPSPDVVEPGEGNPSPQQNYPGTPDDSERSVAELQDFCWRMKQRFRDSNMINGEAWQLYHLLGQVHGETLPSGQQWYLDNGCYGMPFCDEEPFRVKKQMMLKKKNDEEYETFYYIIGCGISYVHREIHMKGGEIYGTTLLEYWGENFPC